MPNSISPTRLLETKVSSKEEDSVRRAEEKGRDGENPVTIGTDVETHI
jgi:hypothetical protein